LVDVILAPYFTKNINFHQHDSSNRGKGGSLPNDYNQMKNWYESIVKLDINACIFHNELSEDFIAKYKKDNIIFQKWNKAHRPSYNDERFYAYLDFIDSHKNIDRIFCTDLYDVIFYKNPFQLMDTLKDYQILCGAEQITRYNSKWMTRKCKEMNYPVSRDGFSTSSFLYNAGIIGGKRENIRHLFKDMIGDFSKIDPKFNANMPVYNHCLEKQKDINIFSGFPLHNIFNSNKVTEGLYIKHK